MTEHSNDQDNQTLTMGFSIVGECGPELVDFAVPSRIYTEEELKQMILADLYSDDSL